jgi:hypothetical protein
MTVKGTSGKSTNKPRGSVKSTVVSTSADEPKTMAGKTDYKPPVSGNGSSRRTWGIIGCIVLILLICCIGTAAIFWFNGDAWLQELMNQVEIQ